MGELRVGVDTGGTFTDFVAVDGDGALTHKVASTPDDPARAVLSGLAALRGQRAVDCVHGTTVGLNALLTGVHAKVAFVTNEGFVDLVEIGRQERDDLYALEPSRPRFPVPRGLRFTVPGRRDAAGRVVEPLPDAALDELAERIARARPDAIAIGLLHSARAPADELRVARRLRALGVPVTCSAELVARTGEFERFTAACLNAAIRPVVGSYVQRLQRGVQPGRVRLLRNSGGILPAGEAERFPLRAVLSGPAGGVVASARAAQALGVERLAAFDMGGTSTDVSLVDADAGAATDTARLAGLPLAVPTLDVHTIGCGGGSLAYADAGGALRVGPQSAGAVPGPACYGQGDEPTVTDAHVALGHIGARTLLGGAFPIDPDRSVRAIERLAKRLGTSARRCAEGILEVAEVAMARAILRITSARAVDPAQVPLLAYGGAGGLHAAALAQRLGMPYALVPAAPGVFSALGLALASESAEAITALHARLDARGARDALRAAAQRLRTELLAEPGATGRGRTEVRLRFAGQGGGLWLPLTGALEPAFRAAHRRLFGFDEPGHAIEAVELRVRVDGPNPALPRRITPLGREDARPAERRRAPLGGTVWPVAHAAELAPRDARRGPLLIEEETCVVRVPSGWTVGPPAPGMAGRRRSAPASVGGWRLHWNPR
ncbi:MAG: hydantoinase/oxoprolinase family protein [Planctomycetes bacterium]|nr:hydantoinase/oxoprolinase family protein [Planctomycetota bacterium]